MAETESCIATPPPSAAPPVVDPEALPGKQIQCRVCLRSFGRDLISPCKCEGTSKFVHRECLDYTRAVNGQFAFAHCTTCKVPYYLRANIHPDRQLRILKFLRFRYVLFIYATMQLIICALANMLYLALSYVFCDDDYKHYHYVHYFHDTELNLYYALGVLLFCLIVGLYGFLITLCDRRLLTGTAQSCQDLPTFCCPTGKKESFATFTSSMNISFCGSLGEADRVWLELLLIMELFVIGFVSVIGIFYSIVFATFFGQQIWRHHSYVSAKRILAKEYVVEDMCGEVKDWCPQLLPPKHAEELKQLGLL